MRKIFAALVFIVAATVVVSAKPGERLKFALQAAEWIRSSEISQKDGKVWPAAPLNKESVSTDLYSGTPGIVLYFLELYKTTGDKRYLSDARSGADYLVAHFSENKENGLYEGISGIGFAVIETYKATKSEEYRKASQRIVQELKKRAIEKGKGSQWSETTDIVSGNAGTGLFLLYAARELRDDSLRELAARVGRRLIEVGKPAETVGTKWAMDDKFPRLMPNFHTVRPVWHIFWPPCTRKPIKKSFWMRPFRERVT